MERFTVQVKAQQLESLRYDDLFKGREGYWCPRCVIAYWTVDYLKSEEVKEMKVKVKKIIELEPGKHAGEIVKVDFRDDPYEYTDYTIRVNGSSNEIKYGVPTNISVDKRGNPRSAHAKLLIALGFNLNDEVDPENAIGKKIEFVTFNQDTDKGTFTRVVDGSVRLTPSGS